MINMAQVEGSGAAVRVIRTPSKESALTHTPRLTVFGGGFPIKLDGEVVGAIGLSGGHYTQDMECARAGLAAIGGEPL